MLIGGYALPAYGLLRATVDIDVAAAIRPSEYAPLERELKKAGFQVSSFSEETPCFLVTDVKAAVEIEVWIKPDGIVIDQECLRRRRRRKISGIDFWIIGPEHFIVNKLSRKDRRAQDEADVLSVLMNTELTLDTQFLHSLAEKAGTLLTLRTLEKRAKVASKQ
jgi:predicted nucleotidyltransferase